MTRSEARWVLLGKAMPLLLVVVIVFTVAQHSGIQQAQENTKDLAEAQIQLRTTTLNECRRLQGLRDEVNRQSETIYLVLTATARVATNRKLAAGYRKFANALLYQPPTDCKRAVSERGSYDRPKAIPYLERLTKP